MSTDPDLDTLLARLRQAEAQGASEEILAGIRQTIRRAGDREAAARQAARDAEKLERHAPGARLAKIEPYIPQYGLTPEIQVLREKLSGALVVSSVSEHKDFLLSRAEPFILLKMSGDSAERYLPTNERRDQEKKLTLGASRFGFVPDLPPGLPWPEQDGKKLRFLAQLDLAEFPHWPGSLLPADGWLCAFAGMPDMLTDRDPWRYQIIHFHAPRESLIRQEEALKGCGDPDKYWPIWHDDPFELVTFKPQLAIDIDLQLVAQELDASQCWEVRQVVESISEFDNGSYADNGFAGHLLGQSGDHETETATETVNSLIASGLHPVPLRLAREPKGPGNDWIHLFSLRSVGSMQWSDLGFIYFVIRRSDLAAGDLRNVCLSLCTS